MDGYITLGDSDVALLYDSLVLAAERVRERGGAGRSLDALKERMFAGMTPRTHGAEFRLLTAPLADDAWQRRRQAEREHHLPVNYLELPRELMGASARRLRDWADAPPTFHQEGPVAISGGNPVPYLLGDEGDEQPYEDADQRLGGNDA